MKSKLLFLLLAVLITSCKQEDKPAFINKLTPDEKYEVTLLNNTIQQYSRYVNNELQETTIYHQHDTTVEMIRRNAANEIKQKIIYYLREDGLASSSIDSSFGFNGLNVATAEFKYENGFLVESSVKWNSHANADSGYVFLHQKIEDGNIVEITQSYENWSGGCKDRFKYNGHISLLDINDFTRSITGKNSKNLLSHASWNHGCPAGPSRSIAYSDFIYLLNKNGYVEKKIEVYTPSYHLSFSEEVTRTIRTTHYAYNFQ